MHPRLQDVLGATEAARQELLDLVTPLTPEQWAWHGPDGGWSVRRVVGHLQVVEDGSVRALFRAFRAARAAGLGQETSTESLLTSLDAARIPEANTKLDAPSFTVPADELGVVEILERLSRGRDGLRTFSAEADGFALAEPTFPHPALGVLNLYQWVLFIGLHERRHVRQVRAILASHAP